MDVALLDFEIVKNVKVYFYLLMCADIISVRSEAT